MSSLTYRNFARSYVASSGDVKLRGTFLQGSKPDLPTLIWLPELTEPAANFKGFFDMPNSKILKTRNVWLLDYRNQGDSDHFPSYEMEQMSEDIVRFMDEQQITLATIGGHGYGAKVAAATAINNMDRFTGVIQYEGGPLNHKYHEAYQELAGYVQWANKLDLSKIDYNEACKQIDANIGCKKWASIFKGNLAADGTLAWTVDMPTLAKDMKKSNPDTANWSQHYGLWPGQTFAVFAAHSRWVHLATNTLPFYNVMPRLQNKFPESITTWAEALEGPLTHWMHEQPEGSPSLLHARMARWLRNQDGVHVLLSGRQEVGNTWIPDRGYCADAGTGGEYIPEHVHHNYKYTKVYEESRARRGVEGAAPGQFLPTGEWSKL